MDHRVPLTADIPGIGRIVIGEAIINETGYMIGEIHDERGKALLKPDLKHMSISFNDDRSVEIEAVPLPSNFACACYERAGITYKYKCAIHRSVIQ